MALRQRVTGLAAVLVVLLAPGAFAKGGGISGYSGRTASCTSCHGNSGSAPTVVVTGPASLAAGTTGSYTLTITGGPGIESGIDIEADNANAILGTSGSFERLSGGELVQSTGQPFSAGKVIYPFTVKAPSTAGTVKLYAAGMSTNGSGTSGDNTVNVVFTITITASTNTAPTVATAAAASASTVTAKTTSLSVLGADNAGEAALIYTWASTGPSAVSFSSNGTNAAKNTTATFSRAGSYTFTCTIRDAGGLTATSSVSVTVQQTLTTVSVSPATASAVSGGTQQFTAAGLDQFGTAQTSAYTWTASGGGSVSTSGLFTATTAGGPYTLTASSGGKSGTASITVTAANQAPTIATAAAASPATVTGATVALSVLGADDGGEAALSYTWSATTAPAAVTFSANGTNAAKNATVTFAKAGSYTFTVTVKDAQNLTATSSVTVTVSPTLTGISLMPSTVGVAPGGAQQFTAAAVDQFGQPFSATFSWTVSGGGTISSTGSFTAGQTPGGPFTVTASSGGKSGTASVTVSSGTPPTVSNAAAASPATVTATSTLLTVLGADNGGETHLTYSWSAANPPGTVSYSANGTNAAKNTTVTFSKAGSYTFTVTIKDAQNLTATSSVNVTVNQTLTAITVTPSTAAIAPNGSQTFAASAVDQFAAMMTVTPSWSVSGGGTINGSGVFSSGAAAGGPFTVTATSGAVSGTASVTVTAGSPPTVASTASAAPSVVTATTTTLSVLGADTTGEAGLTYTWARSSGPGTVAFSPNGSNASKTTTATFGAAGTYTLQVTIKNPNNLTTTSNVTVTVNATVASLTVSPSSATINAGATHALTASALDQFNMPVSPVPSLTWMVDGGGSIDATGVFSSAPDAAGTYTVTALADTATATATVTVIAAATPDAGSGGGGGSGSDAGVGPDLVRPEVSWLGPSAGASLQGVVTLEVAATDNVRILDVTFFVDNIPVGVILGAPFKMTYDTTGIANGTHTLSAIALDTSGNEGLAGMLSVRVQNGAGQAESSAQPFELHEAKGGCSATGLPVSALPLLALALISTRRGRRRP